MKKRVGQTFIFLFSLMLFPCLASAESSSAKTFWELDFEELARVQRRRVGWASWYGGRFHGRRTANGERYNKYAATCASKTLPFGTVLEVTNLKNGRSAVVRVNDRGPYRKNRVLDLSYAVAKKLGFVKSGVAKVAYSIISKPKK